MPHKLLSPYPTPTEVIRTIATALDLKRYGEKSLGKKLDDKSHEVNLDYRLTNDFIDKGIKVPLKIKIADQTSQIVTKAVTELIATYLKTVGTVSMDGIPRQQSLPILLEEFFPNHVASLLDSLHRTFGGPIPVTLFSDGDRAVDISLRWITKNERSWQLFINGCSKEEQDRLTAWQRGDDLPSSDKIYWLQTLSKGPLPENINWSRVRTLLLIARSIDSVRREPLGRMAIEATRIALCSASKPDNFPSSCATVQQKNGIRLKEVFPYIADIQHGLLKSETKSETDKGRIKQSLISAREVLTRIDSHESTRYWLDWHEARWHVFAGDIDNACSLYEKAFQGCLYRSGPHQKDLTTEALVIAASKKSPDKKFLTRLKNAAITFKYDLPSITKRDTSRSMKASDFIEEWEVNLWKSSLRSIFPTKGLFPDTKTNDSPIRNGPLIVNPDAIKADYRHPDRNIKVGTTWKKTTPQLIWFCETNNIDVVNKLLKKGASVNVFSESNETPILMALMTLDKTDIQSSLDDTLYKVLIKHNHDSKTINARTDKKRLLAIIAAVKTGNPAIVKKTISMGAQVDGRGETDEKTALQACLKLMGQIKNPSGFLESQNPIADTPEALDAIRRYSSGLTGFTLDHQRQVIEKSRHDPKFKELVSTLYEMEADNVLNKTDLKELREIAKLLLDNKADPNAEHASPIPGYTPLMLAAELDERELFDAMLTRGGDLSKCYIHPNTGQKVYCKDIATHFNSRNILLTLNMINHTVT
jgi:ankyrin repeat protein